MDTIIGFFKGLDTFQLILLAAGGFLLWPTVQGYLGDFWNGTDDKPNDKDNAMPDHGEDGLTSLVCKWECLIDECHEHGLHDACEKLKEIFPLFVDAHKEDREKDDKPESGVTT